MNQAKLFEELNQLDAVEFEAAIREMRNIAERTMVVCQEEKSRDEMIWRKARNHLAEAAIQVSLRSSN